MLHGLISPTDLAAIQLQEVIDLVLNILN